MYKWIHAIGTWVVQESTVLPFGEVGSIEAALF